MLFVEKEKNFDFCSMNKVTCSRLTFTDFRFQGQYTEEKPETRECEADDLKCALSSGIPAVVGLIIILVIYTICR